MIYEAATGEEPYSIYTEVRGAPRHGEANDQVCRMLAKVRKKKERKVGEIAFFLVCEQSSLCRAVLPQLGRSGLLVK